MQRAHGPQACLALSERAKQQTAVACHHKTTRAFLVPPPPTPPQSTTTKKTFFFLFVSHCVCKRAHAQRAPFALSRSSSRLPLCTPPPPPPPLASRPPRSHGKELKNPIFLAIRARVCARALTRPLAGRRPHARARARSARLRVPSSFGRRRRRQAKNAKNALGKHRLPPLPPADRRR